MLEGEAPALVGPRRRARVTGGRIKAGAFGVGGEINLEAATEHQTVAEQLDFTLRHDHDAGVPGDRDCQALDELHTADPAELGVLAAVLQEHVPDDWPLVGLCCVG